MTVIEKKLEDNLSAISDIADEFKVMNLKEGVKIPLRSFEWETLESDNGNKALTHFISLHQSRFSHNVEMIDNDAEVLLCKAEEGYLLDYHNHVLDGYVWESLLVIKGVLKYSFEDGTTKILRSGDVSKIEASIDHRITALKDSKFIAMFKKSE